MRLTTGIISGICLAAVFMAKASGAQPYPPPGPAGPPSYPQGPGGYTPPAQSPPGYPAPSQPPQGQPAPQPTQPGQPAQPGQPWAPPGGGTAAAPPSYGPQPGAAPAAPGASAYGGASTSGAYSFGERGSLGPAGSGLEGEPKDDIKPDANDDTEYRKESLRIENTIDAATGLLRVQSASSGAAGTFRFSLMTSYFSGSGFLCPACLDPNGGAADKADDATHVGGHVGISATPLSFLEAYLGVHTTASSNTLDSPQLLQVLGDTNFGLKAFMPRERDSIFTAGGGIDAWLLNGVGAVGIDNANFALRGLATVDLNNRASAEDRLPMRFHLNLGYMFDNSGKLVEDYEKKQGGTRISRIRRFGLGINRVDSFRLGLGAEFPFPIVVPFVEWTADVPVNRQNHVCDTQTRATGDQCLGQDARFSAVPSRLSLGARLYPWFDGLAFLAAFDIGTGATSNFIEEVTPEMPWNFWVGLAFAADTKPHVEIKEVAAPRVVHADLPRQPKFIQGVVVEKGAGTPVPDATVRFDGRTLTGMVTMPDGTFKTGDLEAGTYTFNVSANGYRDAQCSATIPFAGAGAAQPGQQPGPYGAQPGMPPGAYGAQPGMPPGPYGAQPGYGQPGQPGQPGAPPYGAPTPFGAAAPIGGAPGAPAAVVTCEVESLPKVGNVNGQLHDGETGAAVGGAAVKITDKLGRSLSLNADGAGAFRFENVPPGTVSIAAEAPGYLKSVLDVEVKAHADAEAQLQLNKKPARPNVVVTNKEIKLKKEVHFQHDSAEILPDSMGILEEIADVLSNRPDLSSIEIQGHTDDSGTPDYNQKLSAARANAVREALVRNGVDGARLAARGYGQEKPLVPNTNAANRAKNRRVQLMIEK